MLSGSKGLIRSTAGGTDFANPFGKAHSGDVGSLLPRSSHDILLVGAHPDKVVYPRHLGVNGEGVSILPRCLVNLLPNRLTL